MSYNKTLKEFYLNNCLDNKGADWYRVYADWLLSFEGDHMLNCAMFSLMSINTNLTNNVQKFEQWKEFGTFKGLNPEKYVDMKLTNPQTVNDYLNILNGNKICNFFMNLYDPDNPNWVTIDRWSYRVVGELGRSKKKYEKVSNAYKKVAEEVGLLPHELQATTWLKFREMYTLKNNKLHANT